MLGTKILILFLPLLIVAEAQNGRFTNRIPIRRPVSRSRQWVQESPMPTPKITTEMEVTSKPIQVHPENSKLTIIYPANSHIKTDVSPPVNHPIRPVSAFWPRPTIRSRPIIEPTRATPQTMMPRFPSYITRNIPSEPLTDNTPIEKLNEPLDVNSPESSVASEEPPATENYPKPNRPVFEYPLNSVNNLETNAEDKESPAITINEAETTVKFTESPAISYPEIIAGVTGAPVVTIKYPENTILVTEAPAEITPTTNNNEDVKPENDHITNTFHPVPEFPLPVNTNDLNVDWPNIIPNKPESNNIPAASVITVDENTNWPPIAPSQPWYPPPTTEPSNPPVTIVTIVGSNVNWPPAVPNQPWHPEPTIVTTTPSVTTPNKLPNRPSIITGRPSNQLYDYKCQGPNGYYSVASRCDEYIECKKNIAIQYTCLDGLHFNPKVKWPEFPCSYPTEVKCQSVDVVREPLPTSECPRQYGFFPTRHGDCGKYTMCQEGIPKVMSCPPGLAFNFDTSSCDWPINVPDCNPEAFHGFTCPAPSVKDDGEPSSFIYKYRYGKSCKKYIACQKGQPRLLSCDSGLSFDEESESCVESDFILDCVE